MTNAEGRAQVVINWLVGHLFYQKETGDSVKHILAFIQDDTPESELKQMSMNALRISGEERRNIANSTGRMARLLLEDLPAPDQVDTYCKLIRSMAKLASTIDPSNRRVVQDAISCTLKEIGNKSVKENVEKFVEKRKV